MFYRMCTKLKSTYVDQLPGSIFKPTGRIHTNYEAAVAATAACSPMAPTCRTSRSAPRWAVRFAKPSWSRDEDHVLLAADYSQIELRVAAELSGDEALMEVFRQGGDIHTATAERIYGIEGATEDMRRHAKTVNFGIIYGISAFGLGRSSGHFTQARRGPHRPLLRSVSGHQILHGRNHRVRTRKGLRGNGHRTPPLSAGH